jgi:hypothetical protein
MGILTNIIISRAFHQPSPDFPHQQRLLFPGAAILGRFLFTAGCRLEDNRVFSGVEFASRGSAAFRLKETDTTLRAAGGRAIREPTFLESYSRDQLIDITIPTPITTHMDTTTHIDIPIHIGAIPIRFGLSTFFGGILTRGNIPTRGGIPIHIGRDHFEEFIINPRG